MAGQQPSVTLTTYDLKRWPFWYNFIDRNGHNGSVYLIPDSLWTFLNSFDNDEDDDHPNEDDEHPNEDEDQPNEPDDHPNEADYHPNENQDHPNKNEHHPVVNIGQEDGAASLSPTPQTTPEQKYQNPTGTRIKTVIRLDPGEYFDDDTTDETYVPFAGPINLNNLLPLRPIMAMTCEVFTSIPGFLRGTSLEVK